MRKGLRPKKCSRVARILSSRRTALAQGIETRRANTSRCRTRPEGPPLRKGLRLNRDPDWIGRHLLSPEGPPLRKGLRQRASGGLDAGLVAVPKDRPCARDWGGIVGAHRRAPVHPEGPPLCKGLGRSRNRRYRQFVEPHEPFQRRRGMGYSHGYETLVGAVVECGVGSCRSAVARFEISL